MRNGKQSLKSHVPLVAAVPPVPHVMKNYAIYVKDNIFKNNPGRSPKMSSRNGEKDVKTMSSYSFRIALLQQVAGELKNLHEDLQIAATFSREKTVMHSAIYEHDNKIKPINHLASNHSLKTLDETKVAVITLYKWSQGFKHTPPFSCMDI